jgi:hypothetical protein
MEEALASIAIDVAIACDAPDCDMSWSWRLTDNQRPTTND